MSSQPYISVITGASKGIRFATAKRLAAIKSYYLAVGDSFPSITPYKDDDEEDGLSCDFDEDCELTSNLWNAPVKPIWRQ